MPRDVRNAHQRLSDLRRAQAADASFENLLSVLASKMQACARLAVFEYEAGSEGHTALAAAFHELADAERQSFNTLLDHLRRHLEDMPSAEPARQPDSVRGAR